VGLLLNDNQASHKIHLIDGKLCLMVEPPFSLELFDKAYDNLYMPVVTMPVF
jgi:hypothetical protein